MNSPTSATTGTIDRAAKLGDFSAVDVHHDLLGGPGKPFRGVGDQGHVEPGPENQQEIASSAGRSSRPRRDSAGHAHQVRIAGWDQVDAQSGREHRHAEPLDQPQEIVLGPRQANAVASEKNRPLRAIQEIDGLLHCGREIVVLPHRTATGGLAPRSKPCRAVSSICAA